ncbi:alpha/beta hydrolase [Gordonia sp. HY285]|uniref:alpha/beta hydrolase n=1 Tax=Gordonia liuliyuniae TaxID=2911517 RepID=UPI001F20B10E|nr:alpha/beta hydrolase [Gordonia liuliyuniae]MCF8608887.1 alpha/beta hydrolase [Gordonia liuliyuniae]
MTASHTEIAPSVADVGSLRARTLNAYVWRASRPLMGVMSRAPGVGPAALPLIRPALNRSLSTISPVPRGTRITTVKRYVDGGQVRGEWTHEADRFGGGLPSPSSGRSILYYLHGSGYLICSPRTHRGLVARLVRRAGIGAFSLDYRLGPEYQFPAGGDDAIRGYRWLLDQGFSGDQIIVGGDSAGGHLAQDLLAANHTDGVPQPKAMVLFSPLYDPMFDVARALERTGVHDPHIHAASAQLLMGMYRGDATGDDPRMRIALTPDMDLPDTLIQYGAREVMADDARTIHRNILAAGGTSTLQAWPDQGHVFQMFPYFTPESRKAVREAKDFIDQHLG